MPTPNIDMLEDAFKKKTVIEAIFTSVCEDCQKEIATANAKKDRESRMSDLCLIDAKGICKFVQALPPVFDDVEASVILDCIRAFIDHARAGMKRIAAATELLELLGKIWKEEK